METQFEKLGLRVEEPEDPVECVWGCGGLYDARFWCYVYRPNRWSPSEGVMCPECNRQYLDPGPVRALLDASGVKYKLGRG